MRQTSTQPGESEPGALIAPHEVRELVARLTERSVEGVRFDEPRTLAGLALDTGVPTEVIRDTLRKMQGRDRRRWIWRGAVGFFLAAGAIGAYIRFRPAPASFERAATPPPIPTAGLAPQPVMQRAGLVPSSQVAYGPTSDSLMADPTFVPPHPVPAGIGISAMVGGVIWGAGDPRASARISPLGDQGRKFLAEDLEALLRYVRERAPKFGIAPSAVGGADPFWSATEMVDSYYGSSSNGVQIPPNGKQFDADARYRIKAAAEDAVTMLDDQIKERETSSMQNGPS